MNITGNVPFTNSLAYTLYNNMSSVLTAEITRAVLVKQGTVLYFESKIPDNAGLLTNLNWAKTGQIILEASKAQDLDKVGFYFPVADSYTYSKSEIADAKSVGVPVENTSRN